MIKIFSDLYRLMTPRQKRQYVLLLALFCFSALTQAVSVASLAPFMALVSNPAQIHINPATRFIYELLGFQTDTSFLIACAMMVIVVILCSNSVASWVTWATFSFSFGLTAEMQRSIYRGYLHRPFATISRRNSAELVAVLTQESMRLIYMVTQPYLVLISQLLIVVLIAAGLLVFDPVTALVALAIIGVSYMLVFRAIKGRLVHFGDVVGQASNGRHQLLNESLGGIKEVKLLGVENFYEERFDGVSAKFVKALAVIGLFGDLPKFVLEAIAFCSLLGLCAFLLARGGAANEIVALLGLYAMAGYKLLPAAQNIFKAASQIKANAAVVAQIEPDLLFGRAVVIDPPFSGAASLWQGDIALDRVSFRYPEAEVEALRELSVVIPGNQVTALVGPSGAGKSTLADMVIGMLTPSSGSIAVGGRKLDAGNLRDWQRSIGYVPQNIFLLDDSIAANIHFGLDAPIDPVRMGEAIRGAHLQELVDSLPGGVDYVVGERGVLLSGGQRQRLGIARALYRQATVLVLDEATSALDGATEKGVMAVLSALKETKTVIMIAHRSSTIRHADHVIMVRDGQLADRGAVDDLMERNAEFAFLMSDSTQQPG